MHISKRHVYSALVGVGVLVGAAGIASAATAGNGNDQVTASAEETDDGGHEQPASYTSSITVPDGSEPASESAERAQLEALVHITADDAGAAAVAAQPGTVSKVELENVDGNVVYTVEVRTATETFDVTVDAGNAHILASEADQPDGGDAHESEHEGDDANENGVEDSD